MTSSAMSAASMARRRGVAMVEFAMCIPLIGTVILLCFLFGWTMLSQQHLRESARYNVWRYMGTHDAAGDGELNALFFGGKAQSISQSREVHSSADVRKTLDQLVAAVNDKDGAAGELANTLVLTQLHPDWSDAVTASVKNNVGLWDKFSGAADMNTQYIRSGGDWRRGQVREGAPVNFVPPSDAVREQFLSSLDTAMQSVAAPGDGLADATRRTYEQGW